VTAAPARQASGARPGAGFFGLGVAEEERWAAFLAAGARPPTSLRAGPRPGLPLETSWVERATRIELAFSAWEGVLISREKAFGTA
jgi:hypothetical protein